MIETNTYSEKDTPRLGKNRVIGLAGYDNPVRRGFGDGENRLDQGIGKRAWHRRTHYQPYIYIDPSIPGQVAFISF